MGHLGCSVNCLPRPGSLKASRGVRRPWRPGLVRDRVAALHPTPCWSDTSREGAPPPRPWRKGQRRFPRDPWAWAPRLSARAHRCCHSSAAHWSEAQPGLARQLGRPSPRAPQTPNRKDQKQSSFCPPAHTGGLSAGASRLHRLSDRRAPLTC